MRHKKRTNQAQPLEPQIKRTPVQRFLRSLCENVAKDHKLCHWVNHPMPGYPAYANRIWKWDFTPELGAQSSGRKGWRLYAYVADPNAVEPIAASAFFCFDKENEPTGRPAKWITAALKQFLAESSSNSADSERFRRQMQPDGKTRSLCLSCYESVAVADLATEIERAEAVHECPISN